MTKEQKEALNAAKKWARKHPWASVGLGFKVANGKETEEIAIVVTLMGVKRPAENLDPQEVVPKTFGSLRSDVQEGPIVKRDLLRQSNTKRWRPFKCGDSWGHGKVTSGTAGVPVWWRGKWHVLSNTHVIAPHWDGVQIGDFIRQPGRYDGGAPSDRVASLQYWVHVNKIGEAPNPDPPPKKNTGIARAYWGTFSGTANTLRQWANVAWLTDCDYRLELTRARAGETQPNPNRVDMAIGEPLDPDLFVPEVRGLGRVTGVRDHTLGEYCQKMGRTTNHTEGRCVEVDSLIRVNYGSFIAEFDHQMGFRALDGGDMSAGGDSGSGIYHRDMAFGGLLFAGGGGKTFANRAMDVLAYGPPGMEIGA